jgi:uncharacterized protein YjbI with pentapeptide repeats
LPYTLPEEVYELYQWHNGIYAPSKTGGWNCFVHATGGLFGFLPLEVALKKSQEFLKDIDNYNYFRYEPNWLLIFDRATDNNATGCVVVLGKKIAPIRSFNPDDEYYEIIHPSLTNMMLNNALSYRDLSAEDFRKGDFRKLNLHRVDLTNANLEGADFRGANITETNLTGAKIKKIKITGALYSDLTILPEGIDKSELIYVGANADLSGFDLRGVYLNDKNLENANLSGANVAKNYLNNANLKNANLSEANLEEALLDGADLSGANLENANLHGTSLKRTILANANLFKVRWVESWVINNSDKDPIFYNTIMPDGSIKNLSI